MSDQPTPTIGRVVLIATTNDHGETEIVPGIVNHVHSPTVIDAMVMWKGHGATATCVTSLEFSADVESHDALNEGQRWSWMAYQKAVHTGTQEPVQHADPQGSQSTTD